jgi:hypothetical protein
MYKHLKYTKRGREKECGMEIRMMKSSTQRGSQWMRHSSLQQKNRKKKRSRKRKYVAHCRVHLSLLVSSASLSSPLLPTANASTNFAAQRQRRKLSVCAPIPSCCGNETFVFPPSLEWRKVTERAIKREKENCTLRTMLGHVFFLFLLFLLTCEK